MSQAFKCDGCGGITEGKTPSARCEITTNIGGTRSVTTYEYCAGCAKAFDGPGTVAVVEAARRLVRA